MPPRDHSRRSVLRAAGYAGATVVVAGTGALSYRVWDSAVLDPEHGRAFDPWRHWRDDSGPFGLVAAGILGANPHNTQPWRFLISDERIEVFADRSRHTALLDPRSRELRVGLGCAIENIAIAASVRGLVPTVTLLPVSPRSAHAVRSCVNG